MNRITALLVVALAAISVSSCSWQEVVNGTTRTHFVVGEVWPEGEDAQHGDRIDVVVTGSQDAASCEDAGGELIWSPVTNLFVCEDVDF